LEAFWCNLGAINAKRPTFLHLNRYLQFGFAL